MKTNFIIERMFSSTVENAGNSPSEPVPPMREDGGWKEEDNKLYKKFSFKNFSEAFAFMTRVAIEAEKMDHHPLWTNVYNTVEIWLSTHDAGNIVTEKDRKLSKKIDGLL